MNATWRLLGLAAVLLTVSSCKGTTQQGGVIVPEPVISGIYTTMLKNLPFGAPIDSFEKIIGVYWKIRLDERGLSVAEYSPATDTRRSLPLSEIYRAPFEPLEMSDIRIGSEGFSFKEPGILGSYEEYRIHTITPKELVGTYIVHDENSSFPGYGDTFEADFFLVKM